MKKRVAAPFAVVVLALAFMIALPSRAQEGVSRKRHVNAERLRGTLEKLSEFGRNPEGGVTRIGFSETDLAAREYVARLMKEAGLEVRVDPAGNMFGSRAGSENLPLLLFGSHIDSVLHGGNFGGTTLSDPTSGGFSSSAAPTRWVPELFLDYFNPFLRNVGTSKSAPASWSTAPKSRSIARPSEPLR